MKATEGAKVHGKAGYGNGGHSVQSKKFDMGRNPGETSGKGGSYSTKKSAVSTGRPNEVHKNKARRAAVVPAQYQPKSVKVKAISDPTGTSNHPSMPNLFKNIRNKMK